MVAVAGVSGGVHVVDLETGVLISQLASCGGPVRVAKFGGDGKFLVTGHDSGQVQYAELESGNWGRCRRHQEDAPMTRIQVWNVSSGMAVTSPLLLHSSWVTDLAIAADGSTLLTAGDRLVWWSLSPPTPLAQPSLLRRRKLSLPLPRSRRSSESKSNRNSMLEETTLSSSLSSSGYCSPMGTPPLPRHHASQPPTPALPLSPIGRRKIPKVGNYEQKELLQTFDIKGSSVNRIFVNEDFTQFVTVDDAGILYILEELVPPSPVIK